MPPDVQRNKEETRIHAINDASTRSYCVFIIQAMAAQNKKRVQRDFEAWFTKLKSQVKTPEESDLEKYLKLREEILNS